MKKIKKGWERKWEKKCLGSVARTMERANGIGRKQY
jgi:hypothetical protein